MKVVFASFCDLHDLVCSVVSPFHTLKSGLRLIAITIEGTIGDVAQSAKTSAKIFLNAS